jgi:hypothetical protein
MLASPLVNAANEPIGILAALSRTPVKEIGFVESFIQLVASRVAAEMEQTRTEKALKKIEHG